MTLKKLALTCAAAMLLAGTAAWADDIDFTCNLGKTETCTGTVTQSGSNYSTTGIHVFNDSGPYSGTVAFNLIFNTAKGTISIDGTGAYTGQNLLGDITSFSETNGKSTSDLSFTTVWSTLPLLAQTFLGSKTGNDTGFVITTSPFTKAGKKGASAGSVDVLITPTPEPASLALFGSGLLAIGGALRRKLRLK